jgi:hypothetical protein
LPPLFLFGLFKPIDGAHRVKYPPDKHVSFLAHAAPKSDVGFPSAAWSDNGNVTQPIDGRSYASRQYARTIHQARPLRHFSFD